MRNLDGFTDLFTGTPKHAPINMYLHEENELQHAFNRRIEDMLASAFPGVPNSDRRVRTFTSADAAYVFRALERATDAPQPDIRIVMMDEFWVNRLLNEGSRKLSQCPADLYDGMNGRWIVQDRTHVPYYMNTGLLAAFGLRRDALEALEFQHQGRACESWRGLADVARRELGAIGEQSRCAFDFGKTGGESWACILLEILSSAGTFATRPESGEVTRFELSPPPAVEELQAFCELFWLGRTAHSERELCRLRSQYLASIRATVTYEPSGSVVRQGDIRRRPDCASTQNHLLDSAPLPIFCRLWYTELTQLLDRRPDLTGSVSILRLPGLENRGQAMRSEWYLAVLEGGASTRTGWEIIDWLTSEWMGTRQYAEGVGLPAHRSFYAMPKGPAPPHAPFVTPDGERSLKWVIDNIWRPGLRRVNIREYPSIAPLLARLLYEILCLGGSGIAGSDMQQAIAEVAQRAEHQIDTISPRTLQRGSVE